MNSVVDMKKYGYQITFCHFLKILMDSLFLVLFYKKKDSYRIVSDRGEKTAEISGKFRYNVLSVSDFPAVGDFVMVDWNERGGNAIIRQVLSRRSCFTRKGAGEGRQEQVVAANIDTVFLCMSLNNDFNMRRLERYLSIAWDSGATSGYCVDEIRPLYVYLLKAIRGIRGSYGRGDFGYNGYRTRRIQANFTLYSEGKTLCIHWIIRCREIDLD